MIREAEKYLKRAKRWDPKEPEVFEGLARHAAKVGDAPEGGEVPPEGREIAGESPSEER